MSSFGVVNLAPLMKRSSGRPEIIVGLIDGPVMDQPGLAGNRPSTREVTTGTCTRSDSLACQHGTLVAGVLFARRGSGAPSICPECTLLVYPIFSEKPRPGQDEASAASPGELANAIVECVTAGAHVLNLSVGLTEMMSTGEREISNALDYAAKKGVMTIAAAGNQGSIGSSPITRHPWVVPVAACNLHGKPSATSNFGGSVGRNGLLAPGEGIASLGSNGKLTAFNGTSAATPFVTGTVALLLSEFPDAGAVAVKLALLHRSHRNTIVPPLMDAWGAFQRLASARGGRSI
jgi:subtilisin family serine protease